MPPFKEPRRKWQSSQAKVILYDDLVEGLIPLNENEEEEDDDVIRSYWESREEYQLYDPDLFEGRLKSLRQTIINRQARAREDLEAYQQFSAKHQASLFSKKGYIQWQNSEAQTALLEDMANEMTAHMTKKALYELRPVYHENFSFKTFCDKWTQEIRTEKYLYTLEVQGKNYRAS